MKVVILCGGLGTRLREETEYKPKPMVEVGGKPILWHIMKHYSQFGFNRFVLCLGYKGNMIKDYFGNNPEPDWEITFAETGPDTMTGGRVKRVEDCIAEDLFMLTYGDGVCDVNLNDLVKFHKSHGKIGTVTGVTPPSRFGHLVTDGNVVKAFNEKPHFHQQGMISGGYFVFNKNFFKYLSGSDDCVLENEPLGSLAKDDQLAAFFHKGFWQCMDTYRDFELLNNLWNENKAAWKIWK